MTTTGAEPVRVRLTEAQQRVLRACSSGMSFQRGRDRAITAAVNKLYQFKLIKWGFTDEGQRLLLTPAGRAALAQEIQDGR